MAIGRNISQGGNIHPGYFQQQPNNIGNFGSVKNMRSGQHLNSFGSKHHITSVVQPPIENKNYVPPNFQKFETDEQYFEDEEEDNFQRANIPL